MTHQNTTSDAAKAFRDDIANQAAEEVGSDVAAKCVATVAESMLAAAKHLQAFQGGVHDLPNDERIYSLGWMCQFFGMMPDILREVARRAGAKPCFALNDVVHYDADAVLTISRFVDDYRKANAK